MEPVKAMPRGDEVVKHRQGRRLEQGGRINGTFWA